MAFFLINVKGKKKGAWYFYVILSLAETYKCLSFRPSFWLSLNLLWSSVMVIKKLYIFFALINFHIWVFVFLFYHIFLKAFLLLFSSLISFIKNILYFILNRRWKMIFINMKFILEILFHLNVWKIAVYFTYMMLPKIRKSSQKYFIEIISKEILFQNCFL